MEEEDKWAWRPPVFATPEELQKKVDEYFKKWYRKKKIQTSNWEIEIPAITTTDLALYLGFESRQSIYDYTKKTKFSYIIKRALFFIEREYEERLLFSQNTSGAIFALKNMWWKDQTAVENMNTNIDVTTTLTDTQKKLIAKRILDGWDDQNTSRTK